MKKLLSFLIFSFLIFFGCNQESEITSPLGNGTNHQYKLITLPAPESGLQIETEHTVYKYIDGEEGGYFSANFSYQSNNGTVSQYAKLYFYEEAFNGWENISQTFNTEGAAMKLGPSMQFNATVKFTYTIYGADLTGINPNNLDFMYIDTNNNLISVQYDYVDMDQSTGMLKVVNARLPHFSRYGFVN